jgi:hypothetical protein
LFGEYGETSIIGLPKDFLIVTPYWLTLGDSCDAAWATRFCTLT